MNSGIATFLAALNYYIWKVAADPCIDAGGIHSQRRARVPPTPTFVWALPAESRKGVLYCQKVTP